MLWYIVSCMEVISCILVAPCFKKSFIRLEAGYPALRCHNLEEHTPQRLEKYRRDLVSSELLSETCRDRNNFSRDERPATSNHNQLQSGVRSRRTSCPRSSSSRVKGTRRGAAQPPAAGGGPAARGAPAAGAELQQRFADRAVHLAQRQLKNLR